MIKNVLARWPAILSVTMIIVLIWGVLGSSSFQACIGQANSQNAQNKAEKYSSSVFFVARGYRDCLGNFADTNNAAITAVATLVIAVFTAILAVVTGRQARLTKETLIADKRAFVFATNISPNWFLDEARKQYCWRIRPEWRNSGETPTKHLRIYVDCELRNTPLPNGFDFARISSTPGNGLLPPNATMLGGAAPMQPVAPITPQDIVDVKAGRKYLYIWGWARYFDVFPKTPEHITRFCFQIHPIGDPFAFVPGQDVNHPDSLRFPYVLHIEGNSAEDEQD